MNPIWIAHRGYPTRYPENTMVGFRAALAEGATWMETDIQLSSDGEPMLYHDETLQRVSGQHGLLYDRSAAELQQINASYASMFGDRYADETIAPLQTLVELLTTAPQVQMMIELKGHSLEHFGIPLMVKNVCDRIQSILSQCVLISFDLEAICYARQAYGVRIGWVLPKWNTKIEASLKKSEPEFVLVSRELLPPTPATPWPGPWEWAVYCIDMPDHILPVMNQGIRYLETNCFGEMIRT